MAEVAVVIPTYNRADLVGRAVQSVLDQVETDWECIVVDDGSTDNTREVLAGYTDPRIHYIYQENQKLSAARNKGIAESTAPIVTFLDSDDLFLPEKLALQLAVFRQNPDIGMVLSGWVDVDPHVRPIRSYSPWLTQPTLELNDWLVECPAPPSAISVRRAWLDQVGVFDPLQYYVEDWDLWLRLSYAGCKMAWAKGQVCLKTVHGNSMIRNVQGMHEGLKRLMVKFFSQADLPPALTQKKDEVFARVNLNGAARALGIGEAELARGYLQEAVRLSPELVEGSPPPILTTLASAALTDFVPDQKVYFEALTHAVRGLSPKIMHNERRLRAIMKAVAAFHASYNRQSRDARRCAGEAILNDPAWLANKGLVKILFTG